MEAIKQNPQTIKRGIQVVLVVLCIVGLYYLYQYLFVSTQPIFNVLQGTNIPSDVTTPITIPASGMPHLYEGGTFTLTTWVYINNWSYRLGFNKHILSIGGNTFDTIRIYLSPFASKLNIKIHTKEQQVSGTPVVPPSSSSPMPGHVLLASHEASKSRSHSLEKSNASTTFNTLQADSELLGSLSLCDIPPLDMQRWVNITVSVDGRTCDVYLDGKLVRSCVLPSFYKVDSSYNTSLLNYGGFGGYLGNTVLYGNALNPADIYNIYSMGPAPSTFLTNLRSILSPSSV